MTQIYNSFDSRFMCMHSVVVIGGEIVFNISYVHRQALPANEVIKFYNEYLKEREGYE